MKMKSVSGIFLCAFLSYANAYGYSISFDQVFINSYASVTWFKPDGTVVFQDEDAGPGASVSASYMEIGPDGIPTVRAWAQRGSYQIFNSTQSALLIQPTFVATCDIFGGTIYERFLLSTSALYSFSVQSDYNATGQIEAQLALSQIAGAPNGHNGELERPEIFIKDNSGEIIGNYDFYPPETVNDLHLFNIGETYFITIDWVWNKESIINLPNIHEAFHFQLSIDPSEQPSVPEPSTLILIGSGFLGLAWGGRLRKRQGYKYDGFVKTQKHIT